MNEITLADLKKTKKVMKYMKEKLTEDASKNSVINETTVNIVDVMIKYVDDLAKEIRSKI